jgi:uncharacterized membrane protein
MAMKERDMFRVAKAGGSLLCTYLHFACLCAPSFLIEVGFGGTLAWCEGGNNVFA